MNPTLPEKFINQAFERDPLAAAAEYLAEFRSDIEAFVGRESVDAVVVPGRLELPPLPRENYAAFVDPSGGSMDSFTLAIVHSVETRFGEASRIVVDCIREVRPPFSPEAVVAELAATLKSYGVYAVTGDRHGGEFPRELFRKHGVDYLLSEKPKSEIYQAFLPLVNSRRVELPEDARLINQLVGLERRTARGGRDSIDHGPGQHDDIVNATAGACALLADEASANYVVAEYIRCYNPTGLTQLGRLN